MTDGAGFGLFDGAGAGVELDDEVGALGVVPDLSSAFCSSFLVNILSCLYVLTWINGATVCVNFVM